MLILISKAIHSQLLLHFTKNAITSRQNACKIIIQNFQNIQNECKIYRALAKSAKTLNISLRKSQKCPVQVLFGGKLSWGRIYRNEVSSTKAAAM